MRVAAVRIHAPTEAGRRKTSAKGRNRASTFTPAVSAKWWTADPRSAAQCAETNQNNLSDYQRSINLGHQPIH